MTEASPNIQNKKTLIVATIGPASESPEVLEQMMNSGLNIARFNTKHNAPEWHRHQIEVVRGVAQKLGKTVPVLLDLQGPEVRTQVGGVGEFAVVANEEAIFTSDASKQEQPQTVVIPADVVQSLTVGNHLILSDGACEFEVTSKTDDAFRAKAMYDCTVKSRKTLNTPGVVLNMPSLLPKDLAYLDAAQGTTLEYVALSFVRDKNDIDLLRAELDKRGLTQSKIVAKIEHQQALDNRAEIIAHADAIMIARGDLGVEVPYYQLPHWQKLLIKECREAGKFVITATQMLLSMITNPKPTRAEVSDVANAVYDGTDAVMLSEESAMGNYPVRAVLTQAEIVAYHEQFVVR